MKPTRGSREHPIRTAEAGERLRRRMLDKFRLLRKAKIDREIAERKKQIRVELELLH
jgi:5S rRNA maturation endonuclease (ribonuclease M5)